MILAGDIGGTKCNLSLFDGEQDHFDPVVEKSFPSQQYPGLEEVILDFLSDPEVESFRSETKRICLGVAGPVVGGRVKTTNLPWTADTDRLREKLKVERILLINDLEATGYGIEALGGDDLAVLNAGDPPDDGNGALIAAGTGLGEALLIRENGGLRPVASEGGHSSFGPRSELEVELLLHLMRRWEHVSYERVLSGPGLVNIFEFLRDSGRGEASEWVQQRWDEGDDPGALISEAAMESRCPLCAQALDLFVSIYGAEAGNLALTVKAVSGVYVGGGIAPKILSKLQEGSFIESFHSKGRLTHLMEITPVFVILNPKTAMLGAARRARGM
ncbi:MAG TPA: glucokinase [Acidobacteriota bacterium]|nr:glucokinase [Acidobacteriota bacterium]